MSKINIMKWLGLQLLTLSYVAILPVSGSWKERVDSSLEFPSYMSSSPDHKISNTLSTVEPTKHHSKDCNLEIHMFPQLLDICRPFDCKMLLSLLPRAISATRGSWAKR
ncbi:hypothetical protein J1605_023152 [Eschrichtius robustus]|uniref:Uncharacterized protein n=1 Tax=Eschrichtius robustus TaxID=9764 RepID=A0AB34H877_ESCRO|nr:hypothetical protein J1605_023152 [Eschrichtius robustus]